MYQAWEPKTILFAHVLSCLLLSLSQRALPALLSALALALVALQHCFATPDFNRGLTSIDHLKVQINLKEHVNAGLKHALLPSCLARNRKPSRQCGGPSGACSQAIGGGHNAGLAVHPVSSTNQPGRSRKETRDEHGSVSEYRKGGTDYRQCSFCVLLNCSDLQS